MRQQKSYKSIWLLLPLAWINTYFLAIWAQWQLGQYPGQTRAEIEHGLAWTPIPVTFSILIVGLISTPLFLLFVNQIKKSSDTSLPRLWSLGASPMWFIFAIPSLLLLFFSTHIGGPYLYFWFRPDWLTYGWLATTLEIILVLGASKLINVAARSYFERLKK